MTARNRCSRVAWAGAALAALLGVGGCGSDPPPAQAAAAVPGEIQLAPDTIRRLGVRTAAAELGPLPLEVPVVGTVAYDASTIFDFYAPTDGWIDVVSVFAVGEPVRAGALLVELYSPSLATIDQQYLSAVAADRPPASNPYSGGLRSIGLTEAMIDALRAKQRSPGHIPFRAQADGVVTELAIRRGAVVKQGERLLQTAAADPMWVTLAVPQSAAALVTPGVDVALASVAYPGRTFAGRVELVYPNLDAATRTLAVRVAVPNPDGALKSNMFVSAVLHAADGDAVVHVPAGAVIRGEHADRVVVAAADGRFAQREVVVGGAAGGRLAIVSGIREGEHVVTSGMFLLDSETNLESGLRRMDGMQGAPPTDSTAQPANPHAHH